jgi:hypothetical protein
MPESGGGRIERAMVAWTGQKCARHHFAHRCLPMFAAAVVAGRSRWLGATATCRIQRAGGMSILGFAGLAAMTPI